MECEGCSAECIPVDEREIGAHDEKGDAGVVEGGQPLVGARRGAVEQVEHGRADHGRHRARKVDPEQHDVRRRGLVEIADGRVEERDEDQRPQQIWHMRVFRLSCQLQPCACACACACAVVRANVRVQILSVSASTRSKISV